jgi:dihydroorotate dehydrogenase (NAD+) catalytic subunit
MTLATNIGSLSLPSPLLTGSGTFGHDATALQFLNPADVGALVLKTVTPEPRHGNPSPRMVEYQGGILNSIGLENRGLAYWREKVAPELAHVPVTVIANAGGHTLEEFVVMVRAFDEMEGVAGIELNLSCPNVDGGTRFATQVSALEEVVVACRVATAKPMWVKLAPTVSHIQLLARAAESAGADALTVSNTYLGLLVDWKKGVPKLGRGYGGVSGLGIKPLTMRLVRECHQAVKIPIIASGGATCAEDVLEFLVAGATAVQVGTAAFRSPGILSEMAGQLREACLAQEVTIQDLIGSLEWPDTLD